MRVLNIIQCANLGGMEQSNLLRLKGLVARGHEVEVISLTPLGGMAPLFREAGIPAIGLEYRGWLGWRSLLAMRREFGRRHADAVLMTGHNFAATLGLVGVRAKRKIQAIHHHHFEQSRRMWKWRVIYRFADAVFDAFTFCSEHIYDEAMIVLPRLQPKARVVSDPFDAPPVVSAAEKAAARIALGVAPGAPVIGNAGWLIARKRFDVFLRTAAVIVKQKPDAVFLIAGDGPDKPKLERLAAELGISQHVRFLGWKDNLTEFYRALDVLLFNTDYDALGRVPIEAAALGVPVVASVLNGGLAEALRPPSEIVLLPSHDVGALAREVGAVLSDASLRERISTAARVRVLDYGNVQSHALTIESLLEGRA
jgi:glycosyltransferase involved in cell wall biosynthesis